MAACRVCLRRGNVDADTRVCLGCRDRREKAAVNSRVQWSEEEERRLVEACDIAGVDVPRIEQQENDDGRREPEEDLSAP